MQERTPLPAALNGLVGAIEQLMGRLAHLRSENQALRHQIDSLNDSNATLQRQLDQQRENEMELHHEVHLLTQKNEMAKAKVESILARLQAIDKNLVNTWQHTPHNTPHTPTPESPCTATPPAREPA